MKFSSIIYPAPSPPSYTHDKLIGELLYVPRDYKDCPDLYDIDGRLNTLGSQMGSSGKRTGSGVKNGRASDVHG